MQTRGALYLVAGDPRRRGRGKDPLLAGILSAIGRDAPAVAYVGAASNDNRIFFMWLSGLLKKAGAGSVRLLPLASRRADVGKVRDRLECSDVIFISGGDVELGMRVLERHGLPPVLARLHGAGKPFIGLSAGSIMLARSWVRWRDADDEATAAMFPCLGLAPLLCDTHAEADGWSELGTLLRLMGPGSGGFGIPSGAALSVAADGSLSALGAPVPRFESRQGRLQQVGELEPA
jgi:cyanophycinase-like exopeptidase